MTISKRVQKELFSAAPAGVLPPLAVVAAQASTAKSGSSKRNSSKGPKKTKSERALAAAIAQENKGKAWTDEEHERFLEALKTYPSGPWKAIADFVGTKNSRQTMTHAQKYRQKHERRERGLRNRSKQRKAARAKVSASTSRSTAKTRSQTSVKRVSIDEEDTEDNEDLMIPSTPQHNAASPSSDSPRSGEESAAGMGVTYLEPMAVDSLMASDTDNDDDEDDDNSANSWDQLKISSISEMFQDFEPMNFLPTMWSTNSLGDIDALAAVHSGASLGPNELFSDSNSTTLGGAINSNLLSLWG